MHAFDILGDPVRRRILELLAEGEQTSGAITDVIRAEGARRFYAVDPTSLSEVDVWLDRFRGFWDQRLDALGTELARGRRASRSPAGRQPRHGTEAGKADPPVKGT